MSESQVIPRDVAGLGMTVLNRGSEARAARPPVRSTYPLSARSTRIALMLYSSPMQVTSAVRFVSWAFCVRITCPTLECQKRSAGWQSDRAERCPSAVMTSLHEISETESFQLGQLHSTQHPRKFGESSGGLVSSCDAGLSSPGLWAFLPIMRTPEAALWKSKREGSGSFGKVSGVLVS